jgi:hypothetical protein
MGRLCLDAAINVARAVADHNLKNMKLSSDNALRSFEYMAQLADAKTGLEVIALSGVHCHSQLNVLGGYTDNLAQRRAGREGKEDLGLLHHRARQTEGL